MVTSKISKRVIVSLVTIYLSFSLVSCGQAQNASPCAGSGVVVDSAFFVPVDTSYSFINYDANHLIFCGDSSQMQRFAKKLYRVLRTGKGNVNVVQIGASHVQGGTFPHQMRRNLLLGARKAVQTPDCDIQSFPVASRGMLFPYSAAVKCNNPFDYKVSRSWPLVLTRNVYKEPDQQLGLCGIAVTAVDSVAEVGITLCEPELDFSTRTIVLLGQSTGGVVPQLKVSTGSGEPVLLMPTDIDSLRRRYTYHNEWPVDSFRILLPCDSGQAFALTGVYLENHQPGITYHSIGVNGASTSDYLNKCPYLTTDLRLCRPDLVIFGIGINDASGPNFDTAVFRQRYLQLVDSIRSVSPDCAFIFITNNDSYRYAKRRYTVNNNGPLVRDAFMRIAAACGGMVWDQFTIMGGLTSMSKWNEAQLAQRDKVHFTRRGYQLLGDMMHNAIFEAVTALKPTPPPVSNERRKEVNPASDSATSPQRPASDDNNSKKYLYKNRKQRKSDSQYGDNDERSNYVFE